MEKNPREKYSKISRGYAAVQHFLLSIYFGFLAYSKYLFLAQLKIGLKWKDVDCGYAVSARMRKKGETIQSSICPMYNLYI
jgi:hypothetical protein